MNADHVKVAEEIRPVVQRAGGRAMTGPEMAKQEARLGLPDKALYFRGRSAVLGDPPPAIVVEVFGLFPAWVVEALLPVATRKVNATEAVHAYSAALWAWSRTNLSTVDEPARLAELMLRVVDAADASALPLFAGWRVAPRPDDPVELLGHAINVLRELRGGLHFAALRANGLGVRDAVVADPDGGRGRLRRTGWRDADADELIANAERIPDLADRWAAAQRLTDELTGQALAVALDSTELAELRDRVISVGDR
ncbi:hypothetical protein EV193_103254 [Herbihabitans rhizosphaerae]|uniref:Uncharacterized protein n=1 Tax=Herbihabitans rhizosphaerae TaxID=1872711 RepID=A0A4Q7KWH9_9PSEU|nr:hypothetical protein [Herbihabitans rhizosphaerae]RZS40936.1 hypothetical protein EV193_103254 [Herbihabitans rhizosphaerae]